MTDERKRDPGITTFDIAWERFTTMNKSPSKPGALQKLALLAALCVASQARAAAGPDSKMAPLDQYLMPRDAEIALARSAAPDSVSRDADVFVLGAHGYELAVKGKNGFTCAVERSWVVELDNPDFWDPKMRAPFCFNAPAARSYWPITVEKTRLILSGISREQMADRIKAGFDSKQLPPVESGSMCYMMSRQGYLAGAHGPWHPHVMLFIPPTEETAWGANQPDSPVFAAQEAANHLTIIMIPVGNWSDGTPDQLSGSSASDTHKH